MYYVLILFLPLLLKSLKAWVSTRLLHQIFITWLFQVMKSSFQKMKRKYLNYRRYNSFSNERYLQNFVSEILRKNSIKSCVDFLNQHAPCKRKNLQGNHTLSKAIMNRARIKSNFLRNRTKEKRILYTQQPSYYVSIWRKV